MPTLDRTLEAQLRGERGRAARLLLNKPFLTADQDGFDVVQTHADWLQRFFSEHTGWVLVVDGRRGFARLRKVTALDDTTRGAVTARADARSFNSRRYVLVCLLGAALERAGTQTTVQELAERVTDLAAATDGIDPFDPTSQHERRALVDALKLLLGTGVVSEQDSDGDYVASGQGNVLYNVDSRKLAQLLVSPRPPAACTSIEQMLVEDRYGSEDDPELDELRVRHALARRLLEDPVVYFEDLTAREREVFSKHRAVLRGCAESAGFVVEQRSEGWAAVDPDGLSTDVSFPGPDSTVKHAALLLSDALVAAARSGPAELEVDTAVLFVAELLEQHPGWARTYQASRDGAARLASDALGLLGGLGLVTVDPDAGSMRVRPAAARFRASIAE